MVGDGGFQMTMCELATAAIHKLPIKILIINNSYLGMVRQWQELFFDNRLSGVDLEGNPDFVKLARRLRHQGLAHQRPAEVDRVLKAAMAYNDGPCIIEAEVIKEDNVFPMIPAGAALQGHDHRTPEAQDGQARREHLANVDAAALAISPFAPARRCTRSPSWCATSRACWCVSRWSSRAAATTSRAWW